MLKAIAARNAVTVLISIHQPRIEVWQLFTNVMVVSQGHLIFHGESIAVGTVLTMVAKEIFVESPKPLTLAAKLI
jgi:ABC-type multidrug transport system ATPase subunit